MMKLRDLTITRRGDVMWHVAGTHHCGPREALRYRPSAEPPLLRPVINVRYVVVVTCAPKLDERGFLFDQVTMADYMATLANEPTDKSCELLADHAAHYLLQQLKHDAPTCRVRALSLTLSPAPFVAEVTASYAPGRRDGKHV